MKATEIEKVYFLKSLPKDINKYDAVIIKVGEFYDPTRIDALMIKQKGNKYELIKKEKKSSISRIEHSISISREEFGILWQVVCSSHEKIRFVIPLGRNLCEVDIYQGKLLNYARVEVEFEDETEAQNFTPPEWFGEEITDLNHEIHKNLGSISFNDMKKRFLKKGIKLIPISNNYFKKGREK